ncbi:carbohydrate ABC transporter permease, partial [bacterium M00.F.Ca.ET.228.01.1.1]
MTDKNAMINRYRWYEIVGIYCGIAVFLTFVLAPFVEGFLVSLKPLSLLFSSPYKFWPTNGSFEAYRTMWVSVPGFARYV